MAATLTVRYYTNERKDGRVGYPMRVVVTNAVDMPKAVFVFQRQVLQAMQSAESAPQDFFIRIADPNALEEYPTTPPGPDAENPYYRLEEVTLFFGSQAELEDAKDLMDTALRSLVLALRSETNMADMEEVTYA
jgi:hypothetical protein